MPILYPQRSFAPPLHTPALPLLYCLHSPKQSLLNPQPSCVLNPFLLMPSAPFLLPNPSCVSPTSPLFTSTPPMTSVPSVCSQTPLCPLTPPPHGNKPCFDIMNSSASLREQTPTPGDAPGGFLGEYQEVLGFPLPKGAAGVPLTPGSTAFRGITLPSPGSHHHGRHWRVPGSPHLGLCHCRRSQGPCFPSTCCCGGCWGHHEGCWGPPYPGSHHPRRHRGCWCCPSLYLPLQEVPGSVSSSLLTATGVLGLFWSPSHGPCHAWGELSEFSHPGTDHHRSHQRLSGSMFPP